MINLSDIGKNVTFQEDIHQYKDKNGTILTSVTQLLSLYKEKFDPTGIIATMCAKKEGITRIEILKRWKDKNETACTLGHNIHNRIEHYIKTGIIIDDEFKFAVEEFSKIKFKGNLEAETRLYSEKFSLAGTCDICEITDKYIYIHDLKTNSRFDTKSKYGNKFLPPLDNIPENHHTTYSLQILIYVEMLMEHGFNVKPGKILYINPETKKIDKYDVLPMKKEMNKLLKHFKFLKDF